LHKLIKLGVRDFPIFDFFFFFDVCSFVSVRWLRSRNYVFLLVERNLALSLKLKIKF
jgi:hypothetical protein